MVHLRKSHLLQAMKEAGLPCSTMWIRRSEYLGILKSPRLPHKRKDRVYTQEQIDAIVSAFSPGGKGRWP